VSNLDGKRGPDRPLKSIGCNNGMGKKQTFWSRCFRLWPRQAPFLPQVDFRTHTSGIWVNPSRNPCTTSCNSSLAFPLTKAYWNANEWWKCY
jgi:hypothetical protein